MHIQLELQDLTEAQAYALAQLVKRIRFAELRQNAISDDEAYNMQTAIAALQRALARVGFNPC
ncbi:MAG: DUF7706 family protein [Acinetobacter ursingii]|uniref:DUF7706 family protein n=1 Tax=Acinetobacter ursingii TaxID=108980 RepID=UPI00148F0C51|nr:hypothetical protein [Acinetobacter ursingii]